jgi:transcriptional regulator with XRE-family HTH domain
MAELDSGMADAGDAEDTSVGRYLARQRRLRGVSLEDLASATRIPRRSLERLESGAFDRQSDGFARGFVRTVAQALGLDVEDAVMRLLGEPAFAKDEFSFRNFAFLRWVAVGVMVIGLGAIGLGAWSLVGRVSGELVPLASKEVFIRRDVVRELARAQRDAYVSVEPLDSRREGYRD